MFPSLEKTFKLNAGVFSLITLSAYGEIFEILHDEGDLLLNCMYSEFSYLDPFSRSLERRV